MPALWLEKTLLFFWRAWQQENTISISILFQGRPLGGSPMTTAPVGGHDGNAAST